MYLHVVLISVSAVVLWLSSGLIISGVEELSRSLKVSRFAVSFLLLGFLTSIPEISIGINSVIDKKPEIFVGNLIGASFVILIFIIPLVATFNRGIRLTQHLQPKRLLEFLLIIIAPLLIVFDGSVHYYEAFLLIFLYVVFTYSVQSEESIHAQLVHQHEFISSKRLYTFLKIVIGSILVFIASRMMITEIIYFSNVFDVSSFMISLLILPMGSNLPELVIAARSITQKKIDIAFGDYVGSAAANTLIFGVFSILSGSFLIETAGFGVTSLILIGGYILFFTFARSKKTISPQEGMVLMFVFLMFLLYQATEVISLAVM
jgi:cation:H+ antiporter